MLVPPGSEIVHGEEEAALWEAFKEKKSATARERLFSHHATFARNIARRYYREQSRGDMDLHELQQLAYAGLLEALDRFDPRHGVPFRPFSAHRISGSIRDGITRMSELGGQISWRRRVRRERVESLSDAGGGKLETAQAIEKLAEIATGIALGLMLEGTGLFLRDDEDRAPSIEAYGAYESAAWKETVTHLQAEILELPERERTILHQHYRNGVSFDDIASLLSLSKGRISQLHRAALLLLRKRMSRRGHFRLGG